MNKPDRYNWTEPGERGKFRRVPVEDLMVGEYQRDEVSPTNTLKVAGQFLNSAMSTLTVFERGDGSLYIVDGLQRYIAAKHRGDIQHLPCMVFQSKGVAHEARVFKIINEGRTNVSAVRKFHAGVFAGDEPEVSISGWLNSRDLIISRDGNRERCVSFPVVLKRTWKRNEEAAQCAILAQLEITAREPLHNYVYKGLWYLEHNGISTMPHVKKLNKAGGTVAMLRSINSFRIETGAGPNERTCGIGIARLINYRRRKDRITLPDVV